MTQLALFFKFFVLAAVITSTSQAYGLWRRISAHACTADTDLPVVTHSFKGAYNSSADEGFANLFCPIGEDDRFTKAQVLTLNVHGVDSSTALNVGAQACRAEYSTDTYSCGSYVTSSGTGNYELHPSLTAWSTAAGAAFVLVSLPPSTANGASSVRAIYIGG